MSVLLTGMMGAGKTTVGQSLAALLGWPYLDNDRLVRLRVGADRQALERQVGLTGVHRAELLALADLLAAGSRTVGAVAGAVVASPPGRALLQTARRRGDTVVWLRASPQTLARRLARAGEPARPGLGGEPRRELSRLAEQRAGDYAATATLVVGVDATTPLVLAAQLRSWLAGSTAARPPGAPAGGGLPVGW